MSQIKPFLGIPVSGDFCDAWRAPQKPLEELRPLLEAVLADPNVAVFGWRHYTPYYDDGETCRFRTCGYWVLSAAQHAQLLTEVDDPDEIWNSIDDDEFELEYGKKFKEAFGETGFGQWVTDEATRERTYIPGPYEGPDEAAYYRLRDLWKAIDGGAFDAVLMEALGDHCHVRVTREGIVLEEYDHD